MRRVLATFTVDGDWEHHAVADALNGKFPGADATVWNSEADYLADLADLGAKHATIAWNEPMGEWVAWDAADPECETIAAARPFSGENDREPALRAILTDLSADGYLTTLEEA